MKNKTVFDTNPNLKECFQTSDGTPFFHSHDAKTHANTLKDKEVKHLKREHKPAKKLTAMQEAKLRADAIETLETVEEVEKALEGETAKSVLKAGEAKIEALKASQAAIDNAAKTE